MTMARRVLQKKYLVVKKEEAFVRLIDKYWLERGYVLVNTCPLAAKQDFSVHQKNSGKCRFSMTKSLLWRKKR
jgi:hypothetical protein